MFTPRSRTLGERTFTTGGAIGSGARRLSSAAREELSMATATVRCFQKVARSYFHIRGKIVLDLNSRSR